MASAISSTKPATNGHAHSPDQQDEGVVATLVKVIKELSEDKCFQAVSKVFEENMRLKTRNEKLEGDLKECDITRRRTFATIEEIQNESKNAKAMCQQRDEELQRLRAQKTEVTGMLQQRQEEVENLKKELEANREEVSKVMKSFKDKEGEIVKLQSSVEKGQQDLKQCRKTANDKQKELEEVEKRFKTASENLESLRGLAYPLEKVDKNSVNTIKEDFHSIFKEAYALVKQFLGQVNLNDHIVRDKPWKELTKDDRLVGIPLPPTNSPAAKEMRVLAALRLIGTSAARHLFQPVYLTRRGGELDDVLEDAYVSDPPRAHWVRSVLLAVNADRQAANGQKRAEAVCSEVSESMGFLLAASSPDKKNEFLRDLQKWCDKARDIWMGFQKRELKFTALLGDDMESIEPGDWRRFPLEPLNDDNNNNTKDGTPANGASIPRTGPNEALSAKAIVCYLWPAFFVFSPKDKTFHIFSRGHVLVTPQVAAAKKEAAEACDSTHRRGRIFQRARREVTDGANGSTDDLQSFLSPGK